MAWAATVSAVKRRDAVYLLRENFAAAKPPYGADDSAQFNAAIRDIDLKLAVAQPDLDGHVNVSVSNSAPLAVTKGR